MFVVARRDAVRVVTLPNPGVHLQGAEPLIQIVIDVRERLLGLSDYDMFCTYSILESPMPLEDYVATLRLTPVTEGDRTFIEWSAEFSCDPSVESDLVDGIASNVFQIGFDALKRHFGGA